MMEKLFFYSILNGVQPLVEPQPQPTEEDQHDEAGSKLGDINFWINSKAYNFVENTHQVWLLAIVDLIIGKREYLPN